ncbi:hypothetical protein [Nocardia alba]|uniref:Uncharacterized protein n=1 Tax=Nocardia alba TaxID=225051 RepID=A0A4R1G141_9NOCA|nr:hypothetical protein [Nocardia alba]TCJ97371.1 hypothetical protein DFR71_3413 [Nocardia alba]
MITRAVAALVLVVPLLAGAVLTTFFPVASPSRGPAPAVAIVSTPEPKPDSAAAALIAALSSSPTFRWQTRDPDSAGTELAAGSVAAAVVVPFDWGMRAGEIDRQVTIAPGNHDLDATTYANLVQEVSAAAATVGVQQLLVGVSAARKNLNSAQFSAALVDAAAGQAGDMLAGAFASVEAIQAQAGPLLADVDSILPALRQLPDSVNQTVDLLTRVATALRDSDLSLGDIRTGATSARAHADSAANAIRESAAARDRVREAVEPLATILRSSGLPQAEYLADQLTGLIHLLGGASDAAATAGAQVIGIGADAVSPLLDGLSTLLDATVDDTTRVSDVLILAANRLRWLGSILGQSEQLLTGVDSTIDQVTVMQAEIRTLLTTFKQVTSALVVSIDASSKALPAGVDPEGARVSVTDPAAASSDPAVGRAIVVTLAGALFIALLFARLAEGARRRVLALGAALGAAVASAALAATVLHAVSRADAAFVFLVLMSLTLAAAAVALLRLCSLRWGVAIWMLVIGAAVIFDGGIDSDDGASGLARRLLPSGYASTGLTEAASAGIGTRVFLPLGVLIGVGVTALLALMILRVADRATVATASDSAAT